MMADTDPVTVRARAFYAAVGRGDVAAALDVLGSHVRWYEAQGMPYERPGGAPWEGAAEVAEHVLGPITTDVNGLELDDLHFTGLGRSVAVNGVYRGVAAGTGRRVDQPFVHVWTFDDAQTMLEFRQFTDTRRFREVLGRP